MIYSDWGFRKNPFETEALPPSEEGDQLLVGRNEAIKKLRRRLDNAAKIPTVEGLNGVGKTSLINVMVYRAFRDTIKTNIGPLYIPCRQVFQLDKKQDAKIFRQKVLMEVAQTLIEKHAELRVSGGHTKRQAKTSLERFLNSAQVKSFSVGAWVLNGGVTSETNTGIGFSESGFEKAIEDWLLEVFPSTTSGGVVCIIDNLELLQTSQNARDTIENLRDTLFSIRGIKWILCGALGIVHGIASSPRLDGRLQKPIVIEDLSDDFASAVYQNRVKAFRVNHHAKLPMDESNFVELFDIMRGNIRSVLSECDEFCMWVADKVEDIEDFESNFFETWLEEELEAAYNAVRSELRPRAMEVFETACQFEVFSPSDCETFGCSTPMAMRPQIEALEEVGLLVSSMDEADKRRKTIQVTSKGWKVRAFLDFAEEEDFSEIENFESEEEEEEEE